MIIRYKNTEVIYEPVEIWGIRVCEIKSGNKHRSYREWLNGYRYWEFYD